MGAAFADPSMAESVSADLPLRRVGQAGEIGATMTSLLSAETSYVTGQVIAVDGGATVR
jgi:NAD(P)-dependent dehydrogenase (short-subunit alcohol dehydrogenase family)